jgi:hypothetical protein
MNCPYPICFVTKGNSNKVVICVGVSPKIGEIVKVTRENVYRGGGIRSVPKFNPEKMIGKSWRIVDSSPGDLLPTYSVEEVVK